MPNADAPVGEPDSSLDSTEATIAPDAVENEHDKTPTTGERFLALFNELNISKVVLVDDRLEMPLDAALATRIFSDSAEAREAATPFFPDIDLSDDNEHVFEQVEAMLTAFDADRRTELATVLATFDEQAADVNVARFLTDLMPADFPIDYLTPSKWTAERDKLLEECSATARTLFLFDQQLGAQGDEGTSIIASLAEHDREAFGARWFCGLLSHTLQKGDEVATWRKLAEEKDIALELFMPISKGNLNDGDAFYGAVYRTVINIYAERMKNLALDAFGRAMNDALEEFRNLDPIDFEHAIAKSSAGEGVSELETIMRLYAIVQRDRVKTELLKQEGLNQFLDAARTARKIADVGRILSNDSTLRLARLRHNELYEAGSLINEFRDPLRNGDLFEIGNGDSLKLWVLIAQPCDLMVRWDGKRAYENNFKIAVLAPIKHEKNGEEFQIKPHHEFKLEKLNSDNAFAGAVIFTKATPVSLSALDLAILRSDGKCEIDANDETPFAVFSSTSWDNRATELRTRYKRISTEIESARNQKDGDAKAKELAGYLLPSAAPSAVINKHGSYEKGKFVYAIKRIGRVREPLASSLLSAFSRYLSRDAHEHDFSTDAGTVKRA